MMKVMVFVIDGLFLKYRKKTLLESASRQIDKALVEVYVDWNKMYAISHQDTFSKSDLKVLQVCIKSILLFTEL